MTNHQKVFVASRTLILLAFIIHPMIQCFKLSSLPRFWPTSSHSQIVSNSKYFMQQKSFEYPNIRLQRASCGKNVLEHHTVKWEPYIDINDVKSEKETIINTSDKRNVLAVQLLTACLLMLDPCTTQAAQAAPLSATYVADKVQPQFYQDQLEEALPLKTIRGKWRVREFRSQKDGGTCKAEVNFKGFVDQPNRGTLSYEGCGNKKGSGNWLLKPARISNGQIQFSARWKVNFSDGTSLIYKGDVKVAGFLSDRPDATIEGDILLPVKNSAGSLSEKKTGTKFQADFLKVSEDMDKL